MTRGCDTASRPRPNAAARTPQRRGPDALAWPSVHLLGVQLVAAGAAFDAVFGVFVAALVVLAVVTMRWAVRRDRAGRASWLERQREQARGAEQNGKTRGRR